jgi:phage recombination protein Bet
MTKTATTTAKPQGPALNNEQLEQQLAVADRKILQACQPRIPYHPVIKERFGIDQTAWKSLVEAIFPGAQSMESVVLALSYCKARGLDPFKRCVHIVPIYNAQLKGMVDTIWPGIGELRTTAFRTGQYAGRSRTEFGPDITKRFEYRSDDGKGDPIVTEVTFPEWAQVTVYRMVNGQRVDFAGPQVYWLETYAVTSKWNDTPNSMWQTRPRGQIDKCAEAAALRAAFPEEIGSEYTNDEVSRGMVLEGNVTQQQPQGTKTERLLGALTAERELEPEIVAEVAEPEQVDAPDEAQANSPLDQ